MRVLVVEDDSLVGDAIQRALSGAGFAVDWVTTATAARAALAAEAFDLLMLDVGLANECGFKFAAHVRVRDARLPILMVTARDAVEDKVAALNLGADDYLVKPFVVAELLARAKALVRRANNAPTVFVLGDLRIDMGRQSVHIGCAPVELTKREWSVLECLALNHGHIVSKPKLMSAIASFSDDISQNAVEVYTSRLRGKLGHAVTIRSVRGMGYCLVGAFESGSGPLKSGLGAL